jgi:hypothetical protein
MHRTPPRIQRSSSGPAPIAAAQGVVAGRRARRTTGAPGRAIAGSLMAALTASLISACGSSNSSNSPHPANVNLNIAHVEQSIEQSILSQRHLHAKVTCPAAVPQEKGKIFTCTATGTTTTVGKHGKHTAKHTTRFTTPFTVTVQNSQGYVTYSS